MTDQEQETPVDNTHLSEEELGHFRHKLVEEKDKAENKIEEYQSALEDLEGTLEDTTSSSAHHQGNIASEEEGREKYYTLIEKEKDKLAEIKMALDRIETGNYGICLVTGKAIQKERLEIKPWARHSVEAMESDQDTGSNERLKVGNTPA